MAFGKRGLSSEQASGAATADPYAVTSIDDAARGHTSSFTATKSLAPAAAGAIGADQNNSFRIPYNVGDILLALALLPFGGFLIAAGVEEVAYGLEGVFLLGVGSLMLFGALFIGQNALRGQAKLEIDTVGLHQDGFFSRRTIAWSDLQDFTLMSVNFKKIAYAKGSKNDARTTVKRLTIPVNAFRHKSLGMPLAFVDHRPDLLPLVIAIMAKTGGKKRIAELDEKIGLSE